MLTIRAQHRIAFILLFSAVAGGLIALSSYYLGVNADTAVTYMNSFVRWTPFMWKQDRYGMLIPALTIAISNPLANVIVHNLIHIMTTVITFFLLAQFLFPGKRSLLIGGLSFASYILLCGLPDVREFLSPWQIYTPAMMFGLLALLVVERNWGLALGFAVIAEWCNFAIVFLLAILVLARAGEMFGRGVERRKLFYYLRAHALVLLLSAVAGYFIKMPYTKNNSNYGLLPLDQAIQGWVRFIADYVNQIAWSGPWLPLIPLGFGISVFGFIFFRHYERFEKCRPVVRSFCVALFVAFAYAFVVGASKFAFLNGYPRRYLIPSLMIWIVAWVGMSVHLLGYGVRFRTRMGLALSFLLVPILMLRFGVPSVGSVKESLAQRFGAAYSQIPESCTHLIGDYYKVWDNVFYSYFVREKPLWGITYRSEVTKDKWAFENFSSPHICYWRGNEADVEELVKAFVLENLHKVKEGEKIVELAPGAPSVARNR